MSGNQAGRCGDKENPNKHEHDLAFADSASKYGRSSMDNCRMPERDRITVGFAILVALLGALGSLVPWIILPAALLAVFLFFWGRKSQRTEDARRVD